MSIGRPDEGLNEKKSMGELSAVITEEVEELLSDFDGDESIKELFWGILSYERVRKPLRKSIFPDAVRKQLSEIEIFASSGDVNIVRASLASELDRAETEGMCKALHKMMPNCIVLYEETESSTWRLIYPDNAKKNYLRVLDLPGSATSRSSTSRALSSLCTVSPETDEKVETLGVLRNAETFFPGELPRTSNSIKSTYRDYLRRNNSELTALEPFFESIDEFTLLTAQQERGEDLSGNEHSPDGSDFDYRIWRLITHNLRLVVHWALKFPRRGMNLEDHIQEGCIGLMTAARKFDFTLGYRFSTYASWWIRQRIQRRLCDNANLIRWPSYRHQELIRANANGQIDDLSFGERAINSLDELKGQEDCDEEISEDISDASAWQMSSAREKERILNSSLSEKLTTDEEPPGDGLDRSKKLEEVAKAMLKLKSRERFILEHRFALDWNEWMTLEHLGQSMGYSRERIRQLESQGLRNLKSLLPDWVGEDWAELDREEDIEP